MGVGVVCLGVGVVLGLEGVKGLAGAGFSGTMSSLGW